MLRYGLETQIGGKFARLGSRAVMGKVCRLAVQFFGALVENSGAPRVERGKEGEA